MASVFGKLQALVGTITSSSASASPEKQSPPSPNTASAHSPSCPPKIGGEPPLATTGGGASSSCSSPGLSGDTLRVPAVTGRPRRQTDATLSSISTVASGEALAASSTVRQQDVDKLLPHRLHDLERISRLHPVSKMLQQHSWDCGLACVCMILRAFGHATCSIAQLARQAQTDSVWTIDLAFLLHENISADFTYYTQLAGVNPEHASQEFYQQQGSVVEDEDEVRVRKLFLRAQQDQAPRILELVIPLIDLKRFLVHRRYVAILLVDKAVLKCTACDMAQRHTSIAAKRLNAHSRSRSVNIFRSNTVVSDATSINNMCPPNRPMVDGSTKSHGVLSWFSRKRQMKDGYLGHYILLIAYIPSLDMFLYRDPGIPEEFCMASASTINIARNRPGTDADCIILKLL